MHTAEHEIKQIGYFGNIWVRSHHYRKAGVIHNGHKHHFDHVTMLVKGSVRIEVDGFEPKDFKAPTFITIKKDKKHNITALEDDTVYYCVFALRDVDGDVTDIYNGDNSPYDAIVDSEMIAKLEELDRKTSEEDHG